MACGEWPTQNDVKGATQNQNPSEKENPSNNTERIKLNGGPDGSKEAKVRKPFSLMSEAHLERLRSCKLIVEKAIKLKRTFSVHGRYPVIRACLRSRGWVEKKYAKVLKTTPKKDKCNPEDNDVDFDDDDDDADDDDDGDSDTKDDDKETKIKYDTQENVYHIMSRLLKHDAPYFIWTTVINMNEVQNLLKDQMINHYFGAGSFTTKAGLCVNLRNFQWFHQVNPDTFFPRCYRLAAAEEKQSFIEDFRLTTARNILKWVVEQKKKNDHNLTENNNQKEESVSSGKKGVEKQSSVVISSQLVQTAILACEEHLNYLEHKDIDVSLDAPPAITEECWDRIIQQYYQVMHNGAMIQDWSSYVGVCTYILRQLQAASPQMDMEGMHNIWIVKPGAQSRGRGITCMNRLEEILKIVYGEASIFSEGKWVVQKYIENPLLIYGTKFDVRQWFLVTDWNPVTIWFYKDCYLRFSSQPFSLRNLDISIHLCNNSIQRRCENSSSRHPLVPTDNMWTSEQFKDFLRKNGKGSMWEHIISPGMKKAIVHTMQMVQDGMKPRKNSFELYGADFLIGKDYIPWLIEINCSPTMSPSTAVTAMLCTNVQEDTIKVVVDRRNERTCDIGRFELLYKQPVMDIPLYIGINLLVEGSCIRKPRPPVQKNVTTIWVGNGAQNPSTTEKAPSLGAHNCSASLKECIRMVPGANPFSAFCPNMSRNVPFPSTTSTTNSLVPCCSIGNNIVSNNVTNEVIRIVPNNSTSVRNCVLPNNYTSVRNCVLPNNSTSVRNCVLPDNPTGARNSIVPNNSSNTKNSTVTNSLRSSPSNNSSTAKSALFISNSFNTRGFFVSNPTHMKNQKTSNNLSQMKNHAISKISQKTKHVNSSNHHKTNNPGNTKIIGKHVLSAWDKIEEIKSKIAEGMQAGIATAITENVEKYSAIEQDEHRYNTPQKPIKMNMSRKTPIYSPNMSEVNMSVKHLILPNRQTLRNPLHISLKILSLDSLDFSRNKNSKSTISSDRSKSTLEKTMPLRYSYNSPRMRLKSPAVPQLHITSLLPNFKGVPVITSKRYTEVPQQSSAGLKANQHRLKKHQLVSTFALFQ